MVSGVVVLGMMVGVLLVVMFFVGSMIGVLKFFVMMWLYEFEGGLCGVYVGCFGYIGVDGVVDFVMVICSILIDEVGFVVGVGGGIMWGLVVVVEVVEVVIKVKVLLVVFGVELLVFWGFDILN